MPVLIQCVSDPDPEVAKAALWGLFNWRSSARSDVLVSAFAGGLNHSSPSARANAARVLKFCGESARPAVPALTRALKDPDPTVRNESKDALAVIAPESLPKETEK